MNVRKYKEEEDKGQNNAMLAVLMSRSSRDKGRMRTTRRSHLRYNYSAGRR